MPKLAERVIRRNLNDNPDTESEGATWREDEVDSVIVRTKGTLLTRPERIVRRDAPSRLALVHGLNAPQPGIDIARGDEGIISAQDVVRLLKARCGTLLNLRLRPSLTGLPNTVAWEAMNERAELISGSLILHAAIRGDTQLVTWATVILDE